MSKRREAFLSIVASLLALVVLILYLSSRIAINLGDPQQQLIVYMPTPQPRVIEQTNHVTVTKLITREVYVSRPTEVPPPPPPVVEEPAPAAPEPVVAQAPAEQPASAPAEAAAPPMAIAEAPQMAPQPAAEPPPPPPWGDQPTYTTLQMGKGGYASWYDEVGTKHYVSMSVTDAMRDSILGALATNVIWGAATLCVDGECASNGAYEATAFSVAGVQASYAGEGTWQITATSGVLTRF